MEAHGFGTTKGNELEHTILGKRRGTPHTSCAGGSEAAPTGATNFESRRLTAG
jgi:hypothetical protein